MADLNRPDYGQVWASTGEKVAPDTVKMQSGWVQEMMPFQYENYLQARQDEAIVYLLQKGVPEYSSTQEYIANKSVVVYQGNLYMATATVANVLPTATASWKRLNPSLLANGAVTVSSGGTGATTASEARTNLGLGSIATSTAPATNGIVVKDANDSLVARTITGTSGNVVITNPDGVAGNINVNVGSNVAQLSQDSSWTSKGGIRLPSGSNGERGLEVAGKIRYNTTLQKFEGFDGTSWNALGASSNIEITTLSGNGATTTFTLNADVFSDVATDVYVGGIYQNKSSYSVSGSTITFSEAPVAGVDNIQVLSRRVVDLGLSTATQVSIQDTTNLYTSSTVEGALREVGDKAKFVKNAILSYPDYAAASTAAVTLPDGQSVFSEEKRNKYSVISGGLVFVRNYSRPVNVLDYVFKTNLADKTSAINAALAAAEGKALYFPAHPEGGFYEAQAGGLLIPSGTHIIGDCGASVIKSTGLFDAGAGAGMRLFDARNANDWSIRDVLLDLSEITNFPVAIRAMRVQSCTRYLVENVHFKTPGAAIASLGCHGYNVRNNLVDVISTDGVAHHDGVIDQWAGSTKFSIKGNRVNGNGIPLYPILVTGTDSNNVATPSYDFEIKDNKVYDTNEVAIWVQGRSGRVYDFQVTGNLIDGVTDYHGLAISEADDFVAAENTIKRVARNGIRVFNENPSYGTLACRNGVLADNIVSDTNRAGVTGTNSEGAAIAVTGNSSGITLSVNLVKAGGHTYAAFLGDNTTGIEVIGEGMSAGSAGLIYNNAPSNSVPGGGKYTPTISATANVAASTPRPLSYNRSGDLVTVSGRIEVTPTATSTTTRLNLSLPIPSNFSDTNSDCSGNANSAFGLVAAIFADVSLDTATLQFQANNTSSNSLFLRFTYRIKQ